MIINYTSAITETHCNVLALMNSDWLLWQNTHFEKGQASANSISLPSHLWMASSDPHLLEQP